MNSLLLTLTALFILVLSALFAAPLFIDWNDYRPAFEEQAGKLLGRDVKVDGQVHLILLPAPELKFDDVKVADQNGSLERPFLEAKSLEAKLDVGTLLTGAVEAHQLTIVDPTLRLEVNEDGTGNWGDVGRPGVPAPFAPKDVLLDSVQVSGGTVEILKDGVQKFVFDNIDGEASAASLSGPYKVSAEYDFDDRRQRLRFSTGVMDAGQFRLKAALRDPDRSTTYRIDGQVTGLGGKPAYDGSILMRMTDPQAVFAAQKPEAQPGDPAETPTPSGPRDTASFVELKGALKASPDRAELPEFDLTIHANGRPQILKGNLAVEFGEPSKTVGQLAARWIDLDTLFGTPTDEKRPSPAAVLYMFAEWLLDEAQRSGESKLTVDIEQAGLGGDLVGDLQMKLQSRDGAVTIETLKAVLPGDNRVAVSGKLSQGDFGALFSGPVEVDGSGLRALTRWAAGDRTVSGRTSIGEFSLSAVATVGDGELKLADALGEVSGTKFRGRLNYQAGDKNLIEVNLDSDRMDLREMLGDGPIWSAWLSPDGGNDAAPQSGGGNLLTQLRDDDVRATLQVGELLLPNIPPGKLDAKLTLAGGTLDVEALDFLAPGAITLNGKGRIENVADAPQGRVDVTLQAETTESVRVLSELFGFSEDVSGSKQLSALVPLDVQAGLVAARNETATKASLELSGKIGGSDIGLNAHATGSPAKLADAEIDIAGSVTGDRPQALLALLFPQLPQDRLSAAAGTEGTLSVEVAGVPSSKLTGKASLETRAMQLAVEGQGALTDDGVTLNGFGSIATEDASLAIPLFGLDAPPSATGVPLTVSANIAKDGDEIELEQVKARIGGDAVEGNARFERDGAKTTFKIAANADRVSLPAVLGILVAWERSSETEEMLGTISADTAEVWPARGFALDIIDQAQGDVTLNAKTLMLGTPFEVKGATLNARVDDDGIAVTGLDGQLFDGAFAASGTLSPRGNGAALTAQAKLQGALAKSSTTRV
ncbi:MAG: AsmA family protein [Methyloceanibacter sp.]